MHQGATSANQAGPLGVRIGPPFQGEGPELVGRPAIRSGHLLTDLHRGPERDDPSVEGQLDLAAIMGSNGNGGGELGSPDDESLGVFGEIELDDREAQTSHHLLVGHGLGEPGVGAHGRLRRDH